MSRAIVSISGRLELLNSLSMVNAELEFAFRDPESDRREVDPDSGELNSLEPTMIDARGAIVRLLLAQREVAQTFDEAGRATGRKTQLRELNLERRLGLDGAPVPTLPSPPPEPTPENSWVVYRDPEDRFLLRHPQDYRPADVAPQGGEVLHLRRNRVGANYDDLSFSFFARDQVPLEARPDTFSGTIVEGFRAAGATVGKGAEGNLPEADWPGRRVYRLELPLTFAPEAYAATDAGRAYFAAYLVQNTGGSVLELKALTEGQPDAFRQEVETMLRDVEIDPPAAGSGVNAPPPRFDTGAEPAAGIGAATPNPASPSDAPAVEVPPPPPEP